MTTEGEIPPRERALLFTVTTGRSGTALLARMLALYPRVEAHHEPKPTFGSALRVVLARPEVARAFWLERKLPRIARSRARLYAETSHLACKGFLESLIELGFRPMLLHLTRPARETATSFQAIGSVPERTFSGVKYLLGRQDPNFLPLDPGLALCDYELCYWASLELEARATALRARFEPQGVAWRTLSLSELVSGEGPELLASRLGLQRPGSWARWRMARLARSPVNHKADRKRDVAAAGRLEDLEARVRELCGLAAQPASKV